MRAIDGDRLLRELTALSHGQVWPGWTYEGIRLLIERQPTLTPPNEWVSVEKRLPDESDGMVLLTNGKIVISGYRNQLFGLDGKQGIFAPAIKRGGGYMQVTYWMCMPAPPDRRPPEGEENDV